MTTHDEAQSYFSRLNSISEKITCDLNKVKSTYNQDAWLKLTLNEQEKILNNQLIDPVIFSKYCHKTKENYAAQDPYENTEVSKNDYRKFCFRDIVYLYNGQDLHTYNYQNVGLKILRDENTGDFQDEHSFPFSYRTKSQINIVLKEFDDICLVETPLGVKKAIHLKLKTKIQPIKKYQFSTLILMIKPALTQRKERFPFMKTSQKPKLFILMNVLNLMRKCNCSLNVDRKTVC